MIYLVNHLTCNTRSQPQYTSHKITTLTTQHKISILAIENVTFLYSPLTRFLYSPQTTQDSILVTDNTRFYTHHRQHKISILVTHNTRFLYTPIYLPRRTQDSILITDNTRFLYSSHTTQDFYTHHRQHKISILVTHNTRFLYTPIYLPRRTQDSILVTDIHAHANTSPLITHTLISVHSLHTH